MLSKEDAFRGDLGDAVQIDVKAIGNEGQIEGYGAIFGNRDSGGDVIMPGSFKSSLASRPASAVKMLWQHDPHAPIGKWDEVKEDDKGLWVKGRLFLGVKAASEAHTLLLEGAVDGLSIGYRSKPGSAVYDRSTGTRTLKSLDLFEVSVVTFPMNDATRVSCVKSEDIDAINCLADAEDRLREAGFSRKDARDFVSRVKRIAQREAGADQEQRELFAVMQKLTLSLRS